MFSFLGRFHFDRTYTHPQADEMELKGEESAEIDTSTDAPGWGNKSSQTTSRRCCD
jgi:hypothetical protein